MEIDNLTVNIFLWEKTSKLFHHISSRQNPLHLSSCYCYGCRFWGAYRFPGFCGNQHIRDPTWSQNPFLKRLGKGSKSCFVGFRCFGNTSCSFHFACIFLHCPLICMHVPFILHSFPVIFLSCSFHVYSFAFIFLSCSFHVYSFPFIFFSYSFHFHSNVHSCPFIFLSFACTFLSFCIHVLAFLF